MPSILVEIVDHVRDTLPARKQEQPLRSLEDLPEYALPRRSLRGALSSPGLSIIAEIKQRSPSRGWIRPAADIEDTASQYAEGGAAAISVLTESRFFGGDLAHMQVVRQRAALPILRKDFVLDPYQVTEARAYGADAVLLIAAVLDQPVLTELLDATRELNLDALVEIHSLSELDKLDLDHVSILGVNNRNLDTFEVDIEHAFSIFRQIDKPVIRVCESGFSSLASLEAARDAGVDAVLVGEALMKADKPGRRLRRWMSALQITTQRG